MENSEKRVFRPKNRKADTTAEGKSSMKNTFLQELGKYIAGKITPEEIWENETDGYIVLSFCDGARIYRMYRYKKDGCEFDPMLFENEKKKIREIFIRLASAVEGRKVNPDDILEDENENIFTLRHIENETEELGIQFRKKNIGNSDSSTENNEEENKSPE